MKLDIGNWQVFWLNPNLNAFPLIEQWHKYQVDLPGMLQGVLQLRG
jgi:hypothetical protein